MNPRKPDDAKRPISEYSSGFDLSGCSPADQQEIKTWLASHPQASDNADVQDRLTKLWQMSEPSAPTDAAWQTVLTKIEADVVRYSATARSAGTGRHILALLALGATAAIVLLAVLGQPQAPAPNLDEPLAVIGPDDVEIITIHDPDLTAVVIGDPPVTEPLTLLRENEVDISHLESDQYGRVPQVYTPKGLAAALIVMPPERRSERQP